MDACCSYFHFIGDHWVSASISHPSKEARKLTEYRKELKQLVQTFGIEEELWNKAEL